MKTKLLAAALAASVLPACSEAGPFDGKTPEEVALFILAGIEKDATMTMPDGATFKVTTASEKPLVLDVELSYQNQHQKVLSFSLEDKGGCSFVYKVDESIPRPVVGDLVIEANLSELVSGKLALNTDATTLEGAKLQCVSSSVRPCEYAQPRLDKGEWQRAGMLENQGGKARREANEKRLNDAIKHLKDNICNA